MTSSWMKSRYFLVVCIIATISSVFTAIQSTRVTPLVDYAYQVENAYRIYQGELPYKDFFLVLPPGVYAIMAGLMVITGGYSHIVTVFFTMILSFLSVFFTGYILYVILGLSIFSVVLLLPLLFTGYVMYPWPSYDITGVIVCLGIIVFFLSRKNIFSLNKLIWVLLGIFCSLPAYFKQNLGLVFVLGWGILLVIYHVFNRKQMKFSLVILWSFGVFVSYGLFFLFLIISGSLSPFMYQTFQFPSEIRRPMVEMSIVLGQYREYIDLVSRNIDVLLLSVGSFILIQLLNRFTHLRNHLRLLLLHMWSVVVAFLLIYQIVLMNNENERVVYNTVILCSWASIYVLVSVVSILGIIKAKQYAERLLYLLPIPLSLTAHAVYLSHHIVGSSYGIWPFFIVLLAICIHFFQTHVKAFRYEIIVLTWVGVISFFLYRSLIANTFYEYIWMGGDHYQSTIPSLLGMGTSGVWIPDMQEMFAFVEKEIPREANVAFLPGEDPFFAVTKRRNPLPYVQLHMGTYPVFVKDIVSEMVEHDVEWVIVKSEWQLKPYLGMIDIREPYRGLTSQYELVYRIPRYDIFKRISQR